MCAFTCDDDACRYLGIFCSSLGLGIYLMVDHFTIAAAILWEGIALSARLTSISKERPETQLFIQLFRSAPILFVVNLFFGSFICNLTPVHPADLEFESFVVASFGLLFWFKLIANYKASALASFNFLAPALSVFCLVTLRRTGWTKSYRCPDNCSSWIDID
jgi:drug/metabolite transporter (DMT)-like permease